MHRIDISSKKNVDLEKLFSAESENSFKWEKVMEQTDTTVYHLWREGISSTPFVIIHYHDEGVYSILMEKLAAYSDYKLFPILCEQIAQVVDVEPEEENVDFFELCSEDWVEESISEEIAYLKAVISAGYRYMFNFGIDEDYYVDKDLLSQFGVGITSSTPRIYGYIQYALKHNMLSKCENLSEDYPDIEVDVPEHKPIGKVKSWHTDGSETWESFSTEDVDMLVRIGDNFLKHNSATKGVVLNDLGTLHMEGIGMSKDYVQAAFWYRKAIECGDLLYAPSNLGDIYRKGGYGVVKNLKKAFEAYSLGEDPYAHYRIGQSLEEGWCGSPNQISAFEWYIKAAQEGHHLAIKRLKSNTSIRS